MFHLQQRNTNRYISETLHSLFIVSFIVFIPVMAQHRQIHRKQARIESLGRGSPVHTLRLFDMGI